MPWSWLFKLPRRSFRTRRTRPGRGGTGFTRLHLEPLEDRNLLATFVVSNTADSGLGSLRQAILDANSTTAANRIEFNISGAGVHTIQPGSALPALTGTVAIDGTTEPGYAGRPLIVLNGSAAGATANGLTLRGSGSAVKGLVINGFAQAGLLLTAGGSDTITANYIGTDALGTVAVGNGEGIRLDASSNDRIGDGTAAGRNLISGNRADGIAVAGNGTLIQGNYIGTEVTGTAALGNRTNGVEAEPGASSITVGGTAAEAGNVISGNQLNGVLIRGVFPPTGASTGNVVVGNKIGTDVTGTSALGNGTGVSVTNSSGNTIGGTAAGAGNVISGNTFYGIVITGPANMIQGNYIGADVTGAAVLANGRAGVFVIGTRDNIIGGTAAGAGNLISGNGEQGVLLQGSTTTTIQGNLIGTDVTGAAALGNRFIGIDLEQSSGNTIGGTSAAARNVISANGLDGVFLSLSYSNLVQGNYIGTNAAGTAALGNGDGGVVVVAADVTTGNTIGGTVAGAGNLISGNAVDGVFIASSGNVVQGNTIGTNAAGTAALGNHGSGVHIFGLGSRSNNLIGGTAAGAGNLISGNLGDGVQFIYGGQNFVEGNLIGTNAAGTAALGNGAYGVELRSSSNNAIGVAGGGNVISANHLDGVFLGLQVADSSETTSGNVLQGNRIGTNAAGTAALGNAGNGVHGYLVAANTIGGTTAATRNVISGNQLSGILFDNSGRNVVEGNYIGTAAAGSAALANVRHGVELLGSSSNTIGGTDSGAGNLVSGNHLDGVFIGVASNGASANNNVLQGNYIGTNVTGSVPLGNLNGVVVRQSNDNVIGGTVGGAGNVIAGSYDVFFGNPGAGVEVDSASGNRIQGNLIGISPVQLQFIENNIGVLLLNATGNLIGGTTPAARNAIANNTYANVDIEGGGDNTVEGNYIGTNGTTALVNAANGVVLHNTQSNVIGGTTAEGRNLLSGSRDIQVLINGGGDNLVQGNFIGPDPTGHARLLNTDNGHVQGIFVTNSTGNLIGGTSAGEGNIISAGGLAGAGYAISLNGGADGNVVQGNYIGTDVTGTASLPNSNGILVSGNNNLIGGTTAAARNIISGNLGDGLDMTGSGNMVQGNYIGTDVTGTQALGNNQGIKLGFQATNNTIGGTEEGAGNVISASRFTGFFLFGTANVIQGNYIGTDVTGTKALGNGSGIAISFGNGNLIGGTTPQARNVISGNHDYGIQLFDAGNLVQGNYIGTDVTGTHSLGNTNGVVITGSSILIGGTATGAGNVISGNTLYGVEISDSGSSGNVVQGNIIGADVTGSHPVGNYFGVYILNAAQDNTIGGTDPGAGNLISGNRFFGIYITGTGTTGNRVQGNLIGTDTTGMTAVGNVVGVFIGAPNNVVGGTTAADRNIVSGNSSEGVTVSNGSGNLVQGNYVGTDVTGTRAIPNGLSGNGDGVIVSDGATNTTVAGNVISGNRRFGLYLGLFSSGTTAQGNYIGTDASGTRPLGNGMDGVISSGSAGNLIGGTTPAARNVISGNGGDGIDIAGSPATGNTIQGNFIGVDVTGTLPLGNALNGVEIFLGSGNTIGGTAAGAGNVISGNAGSGVNITGGAATGNTVQGNYIGTDASGTVALANRTGVSVTANNNVIGGTDVGAGNVIADNTGIGVDVASGTGNSILGNSIHDNGGGGIRLASGANHNQAPPLLTSASGSAGGTTITGTLQTVANTTFRVEFFANTTADPSGYGQGRTYLGFTTVTTDGSGAGNFTFTLTTPLPAGQTILSATATNQTTNDTSPFGRDVSIPVVSAITAPPAPVAVNTATDVSASFADAIPSTTHTAVWNWGDGTTSAGTVSEANGSGTVTGSHS
jgi:parallel beta-helix repeat protein